MSATWKKAIVCVTGLALLATFGFGCAEKAEEEGVVITIGQLNDLTGMASTATRPCTIALQDLVRYYNDEDVIPGVKLQLVLYDTKLDPAREIPGWDWVREQGAQVVIDVLPTSIILKPFAEKDKVPMISHTGLTAIAEAVDEAGYSFCLNSPDSYAHTTLLNWVSENDWNYQAQGRKPKLGAVATSLPNDLEILATVEEYVQANPDAFEYVRGFSVPNSTVTWSGEVEKLKACDYVVLIVCAGGIPVATFVDSFRMAGGTAKFIGANPPVSYYDLIVEKAGWEAVDGTLTAYQSKWWNEEGPIVDKAWEVVTRYHPGEAESLMNIGTTYLGSFHGYSSLLDVLKKVIEEVGADNFDSQAFYDTVTAGVSTQVEGYPEWGYSATQRYLVQHARILEWRAAEQNLVAVSGWLPVSP